MPLDFFYYNLFVNWFATAMVPEAPANVRVTGISTTSIQVAWDSPVNSYGPIVTYKVCYCDVFSYFGFSWCLVIVNSFNGAIFSLLKCAYIKVQPFSVTVLDKKNSAANCAFVYLKSTQDCLWQLQTRSTAITLICARQGATRKKLRRWHYKQNYCKCLPRLLNMLKTSTRYKLRYSNLLILMIFRLLTQFLRSQSCWPRHFFGVTDVMIYSCMPFLTSVLLKYVQEMC